MRVTASRKYRRCNPVTFTFFAISIISAVTIDFIFKSRNRPSHMPYMYLFVLARKSAHSHLLLLNYFSDEPFTPEAEVAING